MEGKADRDKYPVLYLLHGLSDDHSIWCRRTSIERYVAPLGLAVVMPNVHRSFYTDMAQGGKYWTFVSEELPQIVKSFFPISDKREDTFVAGLSMGGYGAFKLGLSLPEKFAAAASLSGALDTPEFANREERKEEFSRIFGDLSKIEGSKNDLFYLASTLVESGKEVPALYQCCGTEDFLYDGNVKFRDYVRSLNIGLFYEECPGVHEWGFWDKMIQNVLKWLPLS
jgi:S-formylglutathione hydrolase FrmB